MNGRPERNSTADSDPAHLKWTEEVTLRTVDPDGRSRSVTLRLGPASRAIVGLLDDGALTEISGTDYLDCLLQIRRRLERDGRLLCCQGARSGVHPSGQLRQFTHGREAYLDFFDVRGTGPETVDIFAPAPPEDVVTLDAQRAAFLRAWNTRHPDHRI
ncbi:hypothetical protein ACFVU3_11980 [Streptomyces sp. NPDC058052]|uniref:hypothetical protein n=1 Tax=Streptomyces sp. NPDC058052 TaxID=3346316 RepID=UPI0036E64585